MACVGLAISAYTVMATRPPSVPEAAINATMASSGTVFADWQWAPGLQRAVGQNRTVLASGGLASESGDFWVDYLRITQGHERWSEALTRMNAQIVVLDVNGSRPAADLVRGSADWRVTHDADGALVAMRATQ
jgi:hypothetical protein